MVKSKYYSKVESNILAKQKMVRDKVEVNKYGLMGRFMMVNGRMIWQMVKEFFIKMEEGIMKEILRMINFMVMENLSQQIKISFMKANSTNINPMVLAHKHL